LFRRIRIERTRLFRLVGRRGLLLLMFGVLWVLLGIGVLASRQPRFSGPGPAVLVLTVLDDAATGWLWIAAGLASIIAGLVRRRMGGRDAVGFNFLLAPPLLWLLGYLWSFAVWAVTSASGRETAWVAAIVWVIMCAFILLIAGWPDPDDPAVRRAEE